MNKKINKKFKSIKFEFNKDNIEVKSEKQVEDFRFLNVEITLMHLGLNYNNSVFKKEVVEKYLYSLKNTPILGYLSKDDFMGHEMGIEPTKDGDFEWVYYGQAFGVIPENCNPRWVDKKDTKGIMRTYLVCDGIMWTKFGKAVEKLEESGFKWQSMELSPDKIDGYYNDKGEFVFTEFLFDGACLLGDNVSPAMDGAKISTFSDNIFSEIKSNLDLYYSKDNFKNFDEEYDISFNDEVTNFPNKGDNDKISLKNSKFKQADYEYVSNIKEKYPDIWDKGGNEFGNTAFTNWGKVRDGKESDSLERWMVRRERFMERHSKNKNIAGIIAVFKWGGIVSKGQSYMKEVVSKEKKKQDKSKKERSFSMDFWDIMNSIESLINEKDENGKIIWNNYVSKLTTDGEVVVSYRNSNNEGDIPQTTYKRHNYEIEGDKVSIDEGVEVFLEYITLEEKQKIETEMSEKEKTIDDMSVSIKDFELKIKKFEVDTKAKEKDLENKVFEIKELEEKIDSLNKNMESFSELKKEKELRDKGDMIDKFSDSILKEEKEAIREKIGEFSISEIKETLTEALIAKQELFEKVKKRKPQENQAQATNNFANILSNDEDDNSPSWVKNLI